MAVRLDVRQLLHLRLRGQAIAERLHGGPNAAERVARQVCGLQAQDIFAASLGVRARCGGTMLGDVERARFEERTVVWTWSMRGTLHLLAADDLLWLLSLVGPVLVAAGRTRRLQLGLDDEVCKRGLRMLRRHLAARGPSTREELGAALAAAGLPTGYAPERHLLYRAALEGLVCMGPDRGARPTFVLLADWLSRAQRPPARLRALALLAERYLAAFGPAGPSDLAVWSGLPAPMVREAWNAAVPGLVEVSAIGCPAWLPRGRLEELDAPPPPGPIVRLLPAFDNYLLGYRDRAPLIDPKHRERVFVGGMISGVILVDGRAAGVWKTNRKGRRVNVTLDPFGKLASGVRSLVERETEDIRRFAG